MRCCDDCLNPPYTVRIITRAKLLGNRRFSEIREFAAIPPGLDLPSWLEEIQAAPGLFVALEDAPNELSHPIQKVEDREAEQEQVNTRQAAERKPLWLWVELTSVVRGIFHHGR